MKPIRLTQLQLIALACIALALPASHGGSRAVILDTIGFWRIYHTLRQPVMVDKRGVTPIPITKQWVIQETVEPPVGWMMPDFDDSAWLRGPARISILSALLARCRMRGRFIVTDPLRVQDLRLSVSCHGGVVVYLNGQELTRAHIPPGRMTADTLAEPYPQEAYLTAGGDWLHAWEAEKSSDPETTRRLALRERAIVDFPIPSRMLLRGVNVIGIEIIRAPYHEVVESKKDPGAVRRCGTAYDLSFNTCELTDVRVSADGHAGLDPGVTRPKRLQLWNSDVLLGDFDMDFGDPAEPLRPIRIVGARNGLFSGKVVAGSDQTLEGIQATVTDLVSPQGSRIAASVVRIRYALPWGSEKGVQGKHYGAQDTMRARYPRFPILLGALSDIPPDAVQVAEKRVGRDDFNSPDQPPPSPGAVVPVWVTVAVPEKAAAGLYVGKLSVSATTHEAVTVPVTLEVESWTLPGSGDYRTWVEATQSPDTLAIEYGLEPWSEAHWRMIARSLELLNEAGSGVLYVPLICRSNLGNEESMVRWIGKSDGSYDYDFTIMEKYLDVAEQAMDRVKTVCFVVWDIYLCPKKQIKGSFDGEFEHVIEARAALKGVGPAVTVVDSATRELETVYLEPFTYPETQKLWRPLLTALRQKMRARGLEDAMMLGLVSDAWPVKAENDFFEAALPGVPWVAHSHLGVRHGLQYTGEHFQNCPINTAYETRIVNTRFAYDDPPNGSLAGWGQQFLVAQHERHAAEFPASRWRHMAELNITGAQRGIGRLGGDVWRCIKDRRGRRAGRVDDRYPESFWRNLNFSSSLLAPGPDGAVATYRFEALREGVQECEARILIEEALAKQPQRRKLGRDLIARCEALLVERTSCLLKASTSLQLTGDDFNYVTAERIIRFAGPAGHYWFVGSGWQDRTALLYRTAGEVARKIGR